MAEYRNNRYGSSERREIRVMCQNCVTVLHALCDSELCPCVGNDSDFRWSRKSVITETQREMSHVIAVRPELAELFR